MEDRGHLGLPRRDCAQWGEMELGCRFRLAQARVWGKSGEARKGGGGSAQQQKRVGGLASQQQQQRRELRWVRAGEAPEKGRELEKAVSAGRGRQQVNYRGGMGLTTYGLNESPAPSPHRQDRQSGFVGMPPADASSSGQPAAGGAPAPAAAAKPHPSHRTFDPARPAQPSQPGRSTVWVGGRGQAMAGQGRAGLVGCWARCPTSSWFRINGCSHQHGASTPPVHVALVSPPARAQVVSADKLFVDVVVVGMGAR